jgi:DNA polymerase elongation subunit (family B)
MKLTILLLAFSSLTITMTNDWQIFQSEAGKFQIEMPELPAFTSQLLSTKSGDLKMSAFMHEGEEGIDDNIMYMISYIDYPENEVNAETMDKMTLTNFYNESAAGSALSMEGKITEEAEAEVLGYDARNFTIKYLDGKAIMRMQLILVRNRAFAIQTVALAANDKNAAQNRFFNSFELLKD